MQYSGVQVRSGQASTVQDSAMLHRGEQIGHVLYVRAVRTMLVIVKASCGNMIAVERAAKKV